MRRNPSPHNTFKLLHFVAGRAELRGCVATTVAVTERMPLIRRGLIGALQDAGFSVAEPDDLCAWAWTQETGAVVVTLESASDQQIVIDLRDGGCTIPVVTLLPEPTLEAYRAALVMGASAVVSRRASLEEVIEVVRAALEQRTLLPDEVARAMARAQTPDGVSAISAREVEWLRRMASGATVEQLAEQAGYSRREMFRRLRDVYRRLGVEGRTEALLVLARRGLID